MKVRDRDMVKPAKKVCLCLSGLAKEIFMLNKNNKNKIEFI
jgi:hypothetical protein